MAKKVQWLIDNIERPNLVDQIDEDVLNRIGEQVVLGYELDKASRKDWEEQTEEGMKIAKQVKEDKTFPWVGAANVKYPLIATASIQFASRAYPEIVRGQDVVKVQVIGSDPTGDKEKRAKRISQFMSWQCLEQMTEWEPDTDTMLHMLPVVGTVFKKTYFSDLENRNISEVVSPMNLVVNNDCARDIETARRITHEIFLYKNDIIERERRDIYAPITEYIEDTDEKKQEMLLEQHMWWDLDDDGYEEPYIAVVHKDSGKVARIAARYDSEGIEINKKGEVVKITPIGYFTKFSFIPDPAGKFYDIGFAHLLGPINETINTVINQLLDAGALSNIQGGFIGKGIRWSGGRMKFDLGEWKQVEVTGGTLKDNIVPLPTKEPSHVLFTLLGSLNEAGMRLASVSETLTGETPGQNVPATTTLAMIEQGLKVFSSIYKRIFRSFKAEYRKLYRLNSIYLQPTEYANVLDEQGAVSKQDFSIKDLDVQPVSDPTLSSEAVRYARANALMQTMQINPTMGGKLEILKRYYETLNASEVEKLLPLEELNKPQAPDPNMVKVQADIMAAKVKADHDSKRLLLETEKLNFDIALAEANIELIKANAIKAIADAESKEVGQQFEQYKFQIESLLQDQAQTNQHIELLSSILNKIQPQEQEEAGEQKAPEAPEAETEQPKTEQPQPQGGEVPQLAPEGGAAPTVSEQGGMTGAQALPGLEESVLGGRTKDIIAAGGPNGIQPGNM